MAFPGFDTHTSSGSIENGLSNSLRRISIKTPAEWEAGFPKMRRTIVYCHHFI